MPRATHRQRELSGIHLCKIMPYLLRTKVGFDPIPKRPRLLGHFLVLRSLDSPQWGAPTTHGAHMYQRNPREWPQYCGSGGVQVRRNYGRSRTTNRERTTNRNNVSFEG